MSLLISVAAETGVVTKQINFRLCIIPAFRECLPSCCLTGVICITIQLLITREFWQDLKFSSLSIALKFPNLIFMDVK
jgi:hypothetical protein